MFFSFITVLSWLGRRPIGDWSAISRGPVPDWSATSCIKSQRGPHEIAYQSATSPRLVADRSPTPLRPLRPFWILVAERSQSGCSVCLTGALMKNSSLHRDSNARPSDYKPSTLQADRPKKCCKRGIHIKSTLLALCSSIVGLQIYCFRLVHVFKRPQLKRLKGEQPNKVYWF